jgi:xylose isomerase
MNWKFSANAGFFGSRRDRFNEYQPARSLAEKVALVARVPGLDGIELKYPGDLGDPQRVRELLEEYSLTLSAVNVDIKDVTYFRHGALSARDPGARRRAVTLLQEGMDMAADFGVELVTTCPLADGYDYPFQIDYTAAWAYFVESVREVVAYRSDVTLLLEYQPHDPHATVMLSNVGKVLHVCAQVGAPNLGANLDIGHSFAAGEAPAEAAALLAGQGLLRYLHSNDNTGDGGDWDMISGSVHFWHWLELLHTLDQVGYQGWIGADIAPRHFGPVQAYETNMLMIQRMALLLERADPIRLRELVQQPGNTPAIYDLFSRLLVDE